MTPIASLLTRLRPETPDVMLAAAESRLCEAEALLKCRQWDGCIYLAGYVAEMLLKVACCRRDSTFPAGGAVADIFGPAEYLWRSLYPLGTKRPNQHKHNLSFWEDVLMSSRDSLTQSISDWEDRLFNVRQLEIIRLHWQVDLRYQAPLATEGEAREVCIAARRLFDNRSSLWS